MSKQFLVFDIETAPLNFDNLSESQQEYILRNAHSDEEKQQKKFEMALSPITAQVVCIGLQMMEKIDNEIFEIKYRKALSLDNTLKSDEKEIKSLSNGDEWLLGDERRILEYFWAILNKYPGMSLVSFNGRSFDAPFLMLRSAIHRVRPARNLMSGTKYNYPLHIDLIDELTFFNPSPYSASRRFNFDFYTRTFGITSPKSEGIDGSMVGELFNTGEFKTIAEYCMRDINATWELYMIWEKYLKFK